MMKWAYGLCTVPERRNTLLIQTLESLRIAGFDSPRLFIDGDSHDPNEWAKQFPNFGSTIRSPRIRAYGNWILGLAELWIRNPEAERFAMFQDDFVTVRNLREYLTRCPYPEKGYQNLYTFPSNQTLAKTEGWYPSNQFGRGAVALVFDRAATMALLQSQEMVERVQDAQRGFKAIDGGVVHALKKKGIREYVHNPSLVQHTGLVSAIGNKKHPLATSFRGEGWDCLEMLRG